jgi:hypothetical protein
MALKNGPADQVRDTFEHLIEDPNVRVRLLAASFLLPQDPEHSQARAIVKEALAGPSPRVRSAALEVIASLGPRGVTWLGPLTERGRLEENEEVRDALGGLIEDLRALVPTGLAAEAQHDGGQAASD